MTNKQNRRPWESPAGWVPLSDAFTNHVFMSAFGWSWIGWLTPSDIETAIAEKAMSPWLKFSSDALPGDIRESVRGVDAARFYSRAVCDFINKAVRSERLRTAYKPKGAGALEPMPLDAWETDHAFLRFDGWSFDPKDYTAAGRDMPCWVFVQSDDLKALDAELEDWRKRLPRFMGDAQERDGAPVPSFMLGSPVSIWGGDDLLVVSAPDLPSPAPALRVVGGGDVVAIPGTVPEAELDESDAPGERPKRQTNPKPKWYPALRTMFEEEEKRHAEWADKHSSLPPRFRTAADYGRLLIEKKFPASMLSESTVRYHVAALKREFGR